MRGGCSRAAALGAGLFLFAAACTPTVGQNTNIIQNSPTQTSPSTASSPSSSATSPPTSSPSSAPASSPTGAALAITGLPFHNGEFNISYLAVSLSAAGGTPPYQWSIDSGTFPPGLGLSSDGVVTGTNTAPGHFAFVVKVADSAGGSALQSAAVVVYPGLTTSQPCSSQCAVEEGCTICGVFAGVSGGLPPYAYSIVGGAVPTGMAFGGLKVLGAFPRGSYNMAVRVTDQFGARTAVSANWLVFQHLTMTTTAFTCGNSPSSCSLPVPYVGGTPGGAPTVHVVKVGDAFFNGFDNGPPRMTSGANCQTSVVPTGLPPGTTITSGGGTVTINIPNPGLNGYCQFTARITIDLVDQSPCGPGNCVSNAATIDINI